MNATLPRLTAIGSGKGGTGKTLISVALAQALARQANVFSCAMRTLGFPTRQCISVWPMAAILRACSPEGVLFEELWSR